VEGESPNNCEPLDVGELVPGILKGWKLDEKQRGEEITAVWREVVGEFFAQHTAPDTIHRGVLTVRVLHSTIQHALTMEKPRLLARIQDRFGKDGVRDLKFRHG
jgi:predicted nucleic acid-binding Zn ribbon protein